MQKRRLRIYRCLLIIGVIGCFACLLSFRDNPLYKGKRLSFYLRNMQSRLAENCQPAAEAIRCLGPKTLPLLCSMIQAEDSMLKKNTLAWLSKHTSLKIHYPSWDYFDSVEMEGSKVAWNEMYVASDVEKQTRAKAAFKVLGPVAQPALPELVKAFHRQHSSSAAGSALVYLGEEGIREVVSALHSPDVWLRLSAAGALGESSLPEKYISDLVECLGDSDERVRYTTACSLHHIGDKSPDIVIPSLAKLLDDRNSVVRTWALRALSKYGRQATIVVPLLMKMLNDSESTIRREAKQAIDLIEAKH